MRLLYFVYLFEHWCFIYVCWEIFQSMNDFMFKKQYKKVLKMLDDYPVESWYLQYMELSSLNEIGNNFGVSFATVGRLIKLYLESEYCLVIKDLKSYRDGYYASEWSYLHEFQGLTVKEIADEHKIDERTVSRILKKFGHKVCAYHPSPIYTCNESYFENIEDHEKAYWLGFIYADGCVVFDKVKNSYILSISLDNRDKEHLELFKTCINSNHPIGMDGRGCVQLRIHSRKMFEDLVKRGVIPKKTKVVQLPKNIKEEYYCSFILGYFDGDGSVIPVKEKNKRALFNISSGSREILEQMQLILGDKVNIKLSKIDYSRGTFKIAYGGNVKVSAIRDWLYSHSPVYLKRKKDVFFSIKVRECEYVVLKCPTCKKEKEKPISETHLRRKTKLPVTFCSHSCSTIFHSYYRGTEEEKKLISENVVKVIKSPIRQYLN